MATWVKYPRARLFPKVKNAYRRTGQFLRAVNAEVHGSAVWARRQSTATESQGPANWDVDVEAITGVQSLYATGVRRLG